jgi:hypothetical protein
MVYMPYYGYGNIIKGYLTVIPCYPVQITPELRMPLGDLI